MGHPALAEKKLGSSPPPCSERVMLKLTPDELALIDQACGLTGERRAPFIKRYMAAVAQRVIAEAPEERN